MWSVGLLCKLGGPLLLWLKADSARTAVAAAAKRSLLLLENKQCFYKLELKISFEIHWYHFGETHLYMSLQCITPAHNFKNTPHWIM